MVWLAVDESASEQDENSREGGGKLRRSRHGFEIFKEEGGNWCGS